MPRSRPAVATLLAILGLAAGASAQGVTLEANSIHGTVNFNNTNPAVLAILATEGIDLIAGGANSTAPTGYTSSGYGTTNSNHLGGSYALSAESNGGAGGVSYTVGATAWVNRLPGGLGNGQFAFPAQTTFLQPPGVQPGGVTVDFNTTVGVEHIIFGTDATCATRVVIGSASIFTNYGFTYLGGHDEGYYLIPAGVSINTTIYGAIGNDNTSNTFSFSQAVSFNAAPDTIEDVCVVVPVGTNPIALGHVQTPFQVVGHTLLAPAGYIGGFSATNSRYGNLNGAAPVSSPALWPELKNLLPDDYALYGTSWMDFGDQQTTFTTGYGQPPLTPKVTVPVGSSVDGQQDFGSGPVYPFVMTPATLGGNILLYDRFVALNPGAASTMNYLHFATEWPSSTPGFTVRGPGGGTYLSSYSQASSGYASSNSSFSQRFSPTLGTLSGSYSLAVMQIYDRPSTWAQPGLNLRWYNEGGDHFGAPGNIPPDFEYHYYFDWIDPADPTLAAREANFRLGYLNVTRPGVTALLNPGDTSYLNHRYCFGEVLVQYSAAAGSGQFVNPSATVTGSFNGLDFESNYVTYSASGWFTGVPAIGPYAMSPARNLAARRSTGDLPMTLTQGSWHLAPSASFVNADGSSSTGNFPGTDIDVACGQRIVLSPGFSISINVLSAGCASPSTPTLVTGQVHAGDATIDHIWYTVANPTPTTVDYCGGASATACPVSTTATPASYSFTVAPGLSGPITVYAHSPYVANVASATDTILGCNHPPVVTGVNQTVASGASVTLSAVASDPDSDPLTWSWSCPGTLTVTGSGTPSPTFTAPVVATTTSYTCTVTVSDGQASASSTATVTVLAAPPCTFDSVAPVPNILSLPALSAQCSVTAAAPSATDDCSGALTATTSDPLNYSTPGSYVIHWKYTDAHGNISTQNQSVTIADTQAPVPTVASLPAITGLCSATVTPPTAIDNCAGTVTATTTDPLSYTAQGTSTVHWTFSDGHGNTTTQTQTVTLSANTLVGTNVSYTSADGNVTATFPTITGCGNTTVTLLSATACALSGTGYQTIAAVSGCYDIHTTATYIGPVALSMKYPGGSNAEALTPGEKLMTFQHVVGGVLTNITIPTCRSTVTGTGSATSPYLPNTCTLLDGNGDGILRNNDGGMMKGSTPSLSPFFVGLLFERANAGPDQTVDEGATVTLDGSGSKGPENVLISYSWVQLTGPAVTLSGGDTANPTFVAPPQSAGDSSAITFELTTTDALGGSSSDVVTITVNDAGSVPTARCKNVSAAAVATCGSAASVNDGSFDASGAPFSLAQSPAGPYPLGSTTVTLTATNAQGSSSCSAVVTVADIAPPQVTCPSSITLVAPLVRASDDDGQEHHGRGEEGDFGAAAHHYDSLGVCHDRHNVDLEGGVACGHPLMPNVAAQATASDNCGQVTLTQSVPAGTALGRGAHTVRVTATDASGASSSCDLTVNVLKSARVAFQGDLKDDNDPFNTAVPGTIANKVQWRSVVPHQVKVTACDGAAITQGYDVKLTVNGYRLNGSSLVDFQDVVEDATGLGADGPAIGGAFMVPVGGAWRFNLDTNDFLDHTTYSETDKFYRSLVQVFDTSSGAPVEVGQEDAILETKSN
jgi:hypothetical protein